MYIEIFLWLCQNKRVFFHLPFKFYYITAIAKYVRNSTEIDNQEILGTNV